jgi:hypothetical protein
LIAATGRGRPSTLGTQTIKPAKSAIQRARFPKAEKGASIKLTAEIAHAIRTQLS